MRTLTEDQYNTVCGIFEILISPSPYQTNLRATLKHVLAMLRSPEVPLDPYRETAFLGLVAKWAARGDTTCARELQGLLDHFRGGPRT